MAARLRLLLRLLLAPSLASALVACGGGEPGTDLPVPTATCTALSRADVSSPRATVGNGDPSSCTERALIDALAGGGAIVFNCGAAPVTITVGAELMISKDTTLDGGGLVTLSGGGATRILGVHSSVEKMTPNLTVQRMRFIDGKSDAPMGRDRDRGGGAMWRSGGSFTVIDCMFEMNAGPMIGQDVAGGAIYSVGGSGTVISGSTFAGNAASNGGAIGSLLSELTIVNSTIEGNRATGMGGNPGMGGNGGGVYMDGGAEMLSMCGVRVANNSGNAAGGGVFRVSNNSMGTAAFDRVAIDGNHLPGEAMNSQGGGMFLFGLAVRIEASAISRNEARFAGGLFFGPASAIEMVNTTIAANTALVSLAGGISFEPDATGSITNCTIANNRAPGMNAFAGAIRGGAMVRLKNTIIAGHSVGNGFNPISCTAPLIESGGNVQFPVMRVGAGSDDPSARCSVDVKIADPMLGELGDHGGSTETLLPADGSVAIGLGADCPPTDQRGEARRVMCSSGSVEP